jgi:2-amino-4-hydroxy-6-hydroxymethyldihydropteridine pyrophosphokinase
MNTAYLLIGGNMGERERYLERARNLIAERCGELKSISSIYETAAWGKTDQPMFLNQAIEILTPLEPMKLLQQVLEIEKQLGRARREKYGPRNIDIDIIFYNKEIHNDSLLIIPHPALQYRRFALEPLNEIAPNFVHPVLKKTIAELLEKCPDNLPATRL